ncbi:hypothetical protein D3C76_1818050 [compost metagenome]
MIHIRDIFDTAGDFGEDRIRYVGNNHADSRRLLAGKTSCHRVGTIAQTLNRLINLLSSLRLHVGVIVNHP